MGRTANDPAKEAALHEYVDAEFTIDGLDSPSREKDLRDAIDQLPGLKELVIADGKVTAHYEPVLLSRKQLETAIGRAGFEISETHASASSPLTNVLTEKKQLPQTSG